MTATVRPATATDAAAIADIYARYVTDNHATFEATPPDAAEFQRRMTARPQMPWLVAYDSGAVVGYAYATQFRTRAAYRWTAECSVYLMPGVERRGLGRALYARLIPLMRELGYVSLYAGVALPNPGSVGLHEAMGFTPVGVYRNAGYKFGKWWDVGWWQLPLRDPPASPAEPREWRPSE